MDRARPELRDPAKAKDVARRLTLKAASRLRRMEYYAGAMAFSARLENHTRVHAEERFYRTDRKATDMAAVKEMNDKARLVGINHVALEVGSIEEAAHRR